MNYYNDNDKNSCAWLKELIAEKLIPKGEVDDRSILDIQPEELAQYRQCHFFAGIGGWPLALALAGWPEDREVWTGSCPCQPLSCAGQRKGHADERHLWPAFQRLIAERRPATVFGEQVASADGREWLAGVRADLEGMGYACGAADLCAAGVGAPQIRQRLYWVADSAGANAEAERLQRIGGQRFFEKGGRDPRSAGNGERPENGWLGSPSRPRPQGHAGDGGDGREPGRLGTQPDRPASTPGGAGDRLADSSGEGREGRERARQTGAQGQSGGHAGECGEIRGRLGEPNREQDESAEPRQPLPGAGLLRRGFWSTAIWHPCRDGKVRRIPVEPALFPLAARLPGRVGLLRGAGNAIVPELAAEFIQAFIETEAA